MSFLSHNSNGKLAALIEIETSLTRGSIIWIRPGKAAASVFSISHPVPHRPNTDTSYFIKVTMKSLSQTIESLSKKLGALRHDPVDAVMPKSISEIHYVLSSPWIMPKAQTLTATFEKDTKITSAKMHSLLAAERVKLTPSSTAESTEIIEEKVFDVRLNGYSVPSWEGLETRNIEVAYAISIGSRVMSDKFKDVSSALAPERRTNFHSSLLLMHAGIIKSMPDYRTYVLIRVHGDMTDVAVMRHDSCVFFGSCETGIRTIIRKIGRVAKVDDGVASSMLSLYIGGKLEAGSATKLTPIMDELGANWAHSVEDLLLGAGIKGGLPERTILSATDHEEFFMNSFKRIRPNASVENLEKQLPDAYIGGLYDII